jgi:hypothetical protein
MVKRCGTCGLTKPIDEFHRRGRIHQSVCRECRRAYDAAYHRRTRARRVAQKKRYNAKVLEWYRALKDAPCSDCGGRFHHAAMTWDHRPGEHKLGHVSNIVAKTHSKDPG